MAERNGREFLGDLEGNNTLPRSFTPENRRKDGAMFRKIRERVREGYYESGHVLKQIADRITGSRQE